MIYFDSDISKSTNRSSILWLEDDNLYLRLWKMSHTIYTANFGADDNSSTCKFTMEKSVTCTAAYANEIISNR